MNKNFFVSVIIPTYNCDRFISYAINSVLNQSYTNLELIIVDDGSTDNTTGIIQKYTDRRIRYFHKENGGEPSARNVGIKESRGDYIAWLDADDVFASNILKTYINILNSDPQIFFLYPNLVHIDEDSRPTGVVWEYKDYSIEDIKALLFQKGRSCIPGIASTMAKRDCYEKVGFLDHNRKSSSDYDFLTKVVKLKLGKFKHVDSPLYHYRQLPTSVSHNLEHRNSNVVAVMKNMLKMYSFKELFPHVDLNGLSSAMATAEENFHIGKVFLDQGLLFAASPHCNVYFKESESYLIKTIKLDPDHCNCIANLGTLYLSMGGYSEALKYLSIANTRFLNSCQINNNLGYAYYKLNELDKARSYLEKAISISPDFEHAKNNLTNVNNAISAKTFIPVNRSNDTLRLLFLADASSIHTRRWLEFFHDRGHEIHIYDQNPSNGYPEGVTIHCPERLVLPAGEQNNDTNSTIHNIFELLKVLDNIKPDLLHCHYLTTYGLWGALCGYIPLICTPWGSDVFLDSANNDLFRKFNTFSLRQSQICTADSYDILKTSSDLRGTNNDFHYIPFGINTDIFKKSDEGNALKEKLNIQTSNVVLSPRQFKPEANIHVLIKAIPEILQKAPDTTFILKNYLDTNLYDKYSEILKRLVQVLGIENNVIFLEEIDYNEMVLLYNIADVTVSLRDTDGSSCSVLEAASCESPLVIGGIESIREWFTSGENAFLVNQKNEKSVANAITDLLLKKDKAKRFAALSRKLVVKKADYRKHWLTMEDLYIKCRNKKVLNKPPTQIESPQHQHRAENMITKLVSLAVKNYHNGKPEFARKCYLKIFEIFHSYELDDIIDSEYINNFVSNNYDERSILKSTNEPELIT